MYRKPRQKAGGGCGNPALDLAADVSVILTYWKLRDGAADSGGLTAWDTGQREAALAGLSARRQSRTGA